MILITGRKWVYSVCDLVKWDRTRRDAIRDPYIESAATKSTHLHAGIDTKSMNQFMKWTNVGNYTRVYFSRPEILRRNTPKIYPQKMFKRHQWWRSCVRKRSVVSFGYPIWGHDLVIDLRRDHLLLDITLKTLNARWRHFSKVSREPTLRRDLLIWTRVFNNDGEDKSVYDDELEDGAELSIWVAEACSVPSAETIMKD